MTFAAGEILTAAALNAAFSAITPVGTGAFTTYVPVLTQSGAVTKTVNNAYYMKVGRLVAVMFDLTATGAGTATNPVTVSLPITAATASGPIAGSGFLYDQSAPLIYEGSWALRTTSTVHMYRDGSNGTELGGAGSGFTAALANADQVRGLVIYQSAT